MQRHRLAATVLAVMFALAVPDRTVVAQTTVCQTVADAVWSRIAAAPLAAQTPLAELTAADPAGFKPGEQGLVKPDQSIADVLIHDYAADADLTQKLQALPPTSATRVGDSDVWLLDQVGGTAYCHTAMAVVVPSGGPAHEIELPGHPDPTELCALSEFTTVTIDGTPALWIEQSGDFSNSLGQSTVSIAALRDSAFTPPCTVTVDYAVADRATHAFCDGVDCVPLIQRAEVLAVRLRRQETAEDLGAGVIGNENDGAEYRRMADIVSADKSTVELPTFGVSLKSPFVRFADQVIFPLRLDDGLVYLARMGHPGLGWRQTADTMLALYRLRDDKVVPAASVYVSATRSGITGVAIE